jgi:hypothetical protein
MRWLVLARLALLVLAACGKGKGGGEVARPAPVEIEWPDAGATE